MCLCVCVCVCLCVYMCLSTCVSVSRWVCVSVRACTWPGDVLGRTGGSPGLAGVSMCLSTCVSVSTWVCVSVCVCTWSGDVPGHTGGHPGVPGGPRTDRNLILSIIGIWYPRRSGKCGGIVATIINTRFNFYYSKYLPENICKWDRVRSLLLKNTETNSKIILNTTLALHKSENS